MKKFSNLLQYAPKKALVVIAAIAAAVVVPAMLLAWGPARTTYTIESPADHVVFNSITNNPVHGDERNFSQVKDASASSSTYADSVSLTAGHEYEVFVYFHNNASSGLNASGVGIANGAYVKVQIPTAVMSGSNGTKAVAYVGASNASPKEVWDDISFSNATGGDVGLKYIPGSATIHNFGSANGAKMSDSIVTTGAALGHDSLNGVVPGCEHYSGYVTFRVRADQPNFSVTKQVRKVGSKDWLSTVSVNPGDQVEFLVTYRNTGTMTQTDVYEIDVLPAGISYVNGTTYLANSQNPNGVKVSDNIVTAGGLNIGDYAAGAAAYTKFTGKVANSGSLNCGITNLTNTVSVKTDNGSKSAGAIVKVTKVCEDTPKECKPGIPVGDARCTTPPELPTTGAGENIATILGLGALVSAFSYYRASRKVTSAKR